MTRFCMTLQDPEIKQLKKLAKKYKVTSYQQLIRLLTRHYLSLEKNV